MLNSSEPNSPEQNASEPSEPPEDMSVPGRQSRWVPSPRPVLLNAYDWTLLEAVSCHQPVTLPQLARLLGRSDKGCQRTARRLFDAQLLTVLPGPPTSCMSPQNAAAVRGLTEAGARRIGGKRYVPPPAWKLEHELLVRDVVAWATAACRTAGLAAPEVRYAVRLSGDLVPDAVLTIPVGDKALCALIECDRSTEPARQWRDKANKYARLLGLPDLTALVGRPRARLLVICPDLARCAWVDALLRETGVTAWFNPLSVLTTDAFGLWRVSGGSQQPFLPPVLSDSNHPSHQPPPGRTPSSER